ncbi:uncharacterized protein AMSG_06055 [Thecamonas trahens ATCC 50062]|uniref:EF-hand domain-containing protein n=1 Tax=Thecamonas trahens ATCC 50062 TaxID=461836 RepID=A0A0L0DCF9_THETB|nr:hypothetical protein AMSG_06055 [Thecamonas trahens ATCC 50062]KNC49776.1 hypothetical protein AMSG_06055 [Thecamonas trahens ATCC 50062]|eukprot:XP_013757560.1 hypothetical protein AMSG_06055 [Thecamonas trahens ATCC 50062]
MGSTVTKMTKKFKSDGLSDAEFTIEDLGEVKIGLKEVQAKEGGVDLEQWRKVWKKACDLDGDFVDGLFQIFDEANNQWVDFREYAIWAALVGRTPIRRKISYCYRVFDRNGNGVLEENELILLCEAVIRTIKRVVYNTPGTVNEDGHQSFALTDKETDAAKSMAKKILKECKVDDDDEDSDAPAGASYKNIQAKWESAKALKDVKHILNFFNDITEQLETRGDDYTGPYSKKYKSHKGDKKGKSKKGKKGKKGKAAASSADESEEPSKSKKGKDKKASKKDKKASKKDKKADKKASKKDKKADKKASKKDKKASKKDKKKGKADASSADESEEPSKSKKGKDKKASKKDKKADKKASKKDKKASKKDKKKGKADASSADESEEPSKSKKGKDKKASKKGKSDKGKDKKDKKASKKDKSDKGKDKKGKDKGKDKSDKGKDKAKGKGKKAKKAKK